MRDMPRSAHPPADILIDLENIVKNVVWSTVSTVDTHGRPRSRVLHPVWFFEPRSLNGLIATRPTAIKRAHIGTTPYVSASYWSPAHHTASLDCHVRWLDRSEHAQAWRRIAEAPEPMGYDPRIAWESADAPDFAVLDLRPYRVTLRLAEAMMRGEPPRVWRAE